MNKTKSTVSLIQALQFTPYTYESVTDASEGSHKNPVESIACSTPVKEKLLFVCKYMPARMPFCQNELRLSKAKQYKQFFFHLSLYISLVLRLFFFKCQKQTALRNLLFTNTSGLSSFKTNVAYPYCCEILKSLATQIGIIGLCSVSNHSKYTDCNMIIHVISSSIVLKMGSKQSSLTFFDKVCTAASQACILVHFIIVQLLKIRFYARP